MYNVHPCYLRFMNPHDYYDIIFFVISWIYTVELRFSPPTKYTHTSQLRHTDVVLHMCRVMKTIIGNWHIVVDVVNCAVCCKIYVNGTNSHDDFCAEADSVCVYRVDLGYTNLYHFKTKDIFLSTNDRSLAPAFF